MPSSFSTHYHHCSCNFSSSSISGLPVTSPYPQPNRTMSVYLFRSYFPRSLQRLRDVISTQGALVPVEKEVKILHERNESVQPDLLADYKSKKEAFLTDLAVLQGERRVVVENLEDAKHLCSLANGEYRWKFEVLVHDDNPGEFIRSVQDEAKIVKVKVKQEKDNILKQHQSGLSLAGV